MSSSEDIRVTTLVEVPLADAFEIFTQETDAWWGQGPRYRVHAERTSRMEFEPRVDGRLLEIYADGDAFELGRILTWEPPKRLVFDMGGRDFGPDVERTEVEVTFEPEGEATRVTIEHRGWERLAADHPARHGMSGEALVGMMGLWWADLLVALKNQQRGG